MKTRSITRSIKQKKSVYRSRVKNSKCRGKTRHCTLRRGCKKTRTGKRKSYCRSRKNKRV